MVFRLRALAAPMLFLFAFIPVIHAGALYFPLDVDKCTGTCGTPPYGIVELDQVNPNTVLVSLTLNAGEGIVQTGSSDALLFNIGGDPLINISNLTSGFVILASGGSAAGLGSFDYGVDCGTACGPGASKTFTGTLSFDVTLQSSDALSTGNFSANGSGIYFATDIIGLNGNTGPVGSDEFSASPLGNPNVAPEPVSFVLVGSGLIGAYFLRRKRS